MPKGVYPRKPVEEKFEMKVNREGDGCHEWTAHLHRDGYGKFSLYGKTVQAHRAAWLIYKGEIPDGMWVLHQCDNRKCVNMNHLYLGTPTQNAQDMHKRGRFVGNQRFGMDLVQKARKLYAEGRSQQSIADELGINQTTISKYVRGAQKRLKEQES